MAGPLGNALKNLSSKAQTGAASLAHDSIKSAQDRLHDSLGSDPNSPQGKAVQTINTAQKTAQRVQKARAVAQKARILAAVLPNLWIIILILLVVVLLGVAVSKVFGIGASSTGEALSGNTINIATIENCETATNAAECFINSVCSEGTQATFAQQFDVDIAKDVTCPKPKNTTRGGGSPGINPGTSPQFEQ